VTNAVDSGIGNESNYRDKGVFVSIPFDALLSADSRVVTGFSLAPWTRDVGQMINSPVDLYRMVEKPLVIDMHKSDGLSRFGDIEDDYNLPYLGSPMWDRPFENLGKMTVQDWGHGAGALGTRRFGSMGCWERARCSSRRRAIAAWTDTFSVTPDPVRWIGSGRSGSGCRSRRLAGPGSPRCPNTTRA